MTDKFRHAREHDWYLYTAKALGTGHGERGARHRKEQNRRARRVLKQELRRELGY